MRIIAGEFRGRRLAAPPGKGTRPMLDRVREAIFSTLGPWFGQEAPAVLDLFAGTGSLGLEALSRGARFARFCERDPQARRVLEENLASLGASDRAEVRADDALSSHAFAGGPYDVVFLDPPFPLVRQQVGRRQVFGALEELLAEGADSPVAAEGVCVLHVPRGQLRESDFEPRFVRREATYGAQSLWYLQRED